MGSIFGDEIDCGNFFDQIDDLIEFPPENECGGGNLIGPGDCEDFPSMWTNSLSKSGPIFIGSHGDPEPDLSAELSVPYEDIVQLEWLSTFVEDSFSCGGLTIGKDDLCAKKDPSVNQFQTSSPVSVLESSSSSSSSTCSGAKTLPLNLTHCGPQRARSKRPRPTTFNPRAAIQLISPVTPPVEAPHPFAAPMLETENFADSGPLTKKVPKKKIKAAIPCELVQTTSQNLAGQAVRKCLHCEITQTPQWRSGPLGPKTLCNACGVRYKSGRLFPEYRPAASPTFVPLVHSNSHKKVVEMRSRGTFLEK